MSRVMSAQSGKFSELSDGVDLYYQFFNDKVHFVTFVVRGLVGSFDEYTVKD